MTGRYLVRRALVVDAPTIARVHVDAWRESYSGIVSPRTLERLSVERRAMMHAQRIARADDDSATFVAVDPGRGAVGFGVCGTARSGPPGFPAEFHALYLVEAAKGQGLGRRLMRRMARWMTNRGHGSAFVLVLKENARARGFYEHLGGRLCHEAPFTIEGETLVEVGYAWDDLTPLLDGGPPPARYLLPVPRGDG